MLGFLKYLNDNKISKIHKKIAETMSINNVDDQGLTNHYKDYLKYKHLMHNENILFEDFFNNKLNKEEFEKNIELFGDKVQNTILENKAKKLKHSVMSNKYKELEFEGIDGIFRTLVEENISRDLIQQFITKKLSAIYNSYEYEDHLNEFINNNINWSKESLLNKIKTKKTEVEILSNEDNKILLKIPSFKESKIFGSRMWCVTREEKHFKNYTSNLSFFCFLYDFNKSPQDNESLKAIIINPKETEEIYLKDDIIVERSRGYDPYLEFDLEFKSKIPKIKKEDIKKAYIKEIEKEKAPFFRSFLNENLYNLIKDNPSVSTYIQNLKAPIYNFLDNEDKKTYRIKNNEKNMFTEKIGQEEYNQIVYYSLSSYSLELKDTIELTLGSSEFDKLLENNNSVYDKKETVSYLLENKKSRLKKYEILKEIKNQNILSSKDFKEIFSNQKSINFEAMFFLYTEEPDIFNELKESKEMSSILNERENAHNIKEFLLESNKSKKSLEMFDSLNIKKEFKEYIIEEVFSDLYKLQDFFEDNIDFFEKDHIQKTIKEKIKREPYNAKIIVNLLTSNKEKINKIGEYIIKEDSMLSILSKINISSLNEVKYKALSENKSFKEKILKEASSDIGLKDFTDYETVASIFNKEERLLFNEKVRDSMTIKKNNDFIVDIEDYREKDKEVIIKKTLESDEKLKMSKNKNRL